MKVQQSKIDFHFFICTNIKEKGGGCGVLGSIQLLDELKSWAKGQSFGKKIRINKSGCLGRCEEGVVAVAYPSAEWIVNATSNDLAEMKKFILSRMEGLAESDHQSS
jgi:(2Fe-2S) ferredoxin